MALLLKDHNVFKCFKHINETIFYSELGSSKVILDAGYNIDSLMVSTFSVCEYVHIRLPHESFPQLDARLCNGNRPIDR